MEFCGVREQFGMSDQPQRKLPTLDPTWWFDGDLPGLDDATIENTIQTALGSWSKWCALQWSKAATKASATLLIITTLIDGPSNVLADCQLPYQGMRQLLMRLDLERFTAKLNPDGGYIGLTHVLAHEGGHAEGLMHLPFDSTPDLMNATYRKDIWEPQAEEGAIVKSLYGVPRTIPNAPSVGDYRVNFSVPGMSGEILLNPTEIGCNAKLLIERSGKKVSLSGSKPWG